MLQGAGHRGVGVKPDMGNRSQGWLLHAVWDRGYLETDIEGSVVRNYVIKLGGSEVAPAAPESTTFSVHESLGIRVSRFVQTGPIGIVQQLPYIAVYV